jgi:hypothetical protein
MTLILHRKSRRCNEEKLRGELLHQHYFSHGQPPFVPSQSSNYVILSMALLSPYLREPNVEGNQANGATQLGS